MKSSITIGELAARFGLATHVLRHWESMGLLEPSRQSGGHRRYGEHDLERVMFILKAKEVGLSLEDMREFLRAPAGADRVALLRDQQARLEERVRAAQEALELLAHVLRCEHHDVMQCPNFRAMLHN
ncbi:MerR family transcriptional regulator [Allokutzneria sp. A3M-2-11 16]|uniref:MerR family transcriptional regulator n=1 Tax=Allokutzneria sp. A3M-2-11 16 TaxID=2962043 RepID=UPI0020B72722|nr:MerR family transcriptional regulator [Allokutzneria sp. A3M-2-11 16]MCP3804826.1 MerR family transcriptional regulator [Allokutzneria sp. A3M-2-11 16]